MIVCCSCGAGQLFADIPDDGEANYINRVLASLVGDADENLTPELTSHSGRSGPASFANEHKDMQTQWLIQRGGWTVDGLLTVFNYIAGTANIDSRVGRVLSAWESA